MATVNLTPGTVEIALAPWESILSLRGSLHVPLEHILSASVEPPPDRWRGLWTKLVGASLPGVIALGTFITGDGLVFYDVRHGEKCLVLRLRDEWYKAVYVEVHPPPEPEQLAGQIQAAIAAPSSGEGRGR